MQFRSNRICSFLLKYMNIEINKYNLFHGGCLIWNRNRLSYYLLYHIFGQYNPIRNGAVVVVWQLDLQLSSQSVPITTKVVSLNPAHCELYSIHHFVIKLVKELQDSADLTVLKNKDIQH
jgi:hypothetical protein